MIDSLRRVDDDGQVWVLCLSDETYDALLVLDRTGVTPIRLSDFEQANPQVAAVRDERSIAEYYFTTTPWLVRYVTRIASELEWVTYLDADLWFFASPRPIYDELVSSSVGIIPHRFPSAQSWRLRYGTYNVGWVSFRTDDAGTACADWWAARCLEWCGDKPDNGRFADQGYLDGFETATDRVHVIENAGADVAPWNLRSHRTTRQDSNGVLVDGQPLIFFHFHGITRNVKRYYFNHASYGAKTTSTVRDGIYLPYLTALRRVEREVSSMLPKEGSIARRSLGGSDFGTLRRGVLRRVASLRRDFIEVSTIEADGHVAS